MTQKKLSILTLFVVLVGAALLNEFILRNSQTEQNREVASFGERFEPEQIKWEQELAKTISRENGKTLLGSKPSLNEKFLYEALAGKYEARVVDGKLLKISLLANQTALTLNFDNLIKDYSSIFKNAKAFENLNTGAVTENIVLKNIDGKSIGIVHVQKDDQGRIVNIEIQ